MGIHLLNNLPLFFHSFAFYVVTTYKQIYSIFLRKRIV